MDQEGVRQGHRAHRCSFSSVCPWVWVWAAHLCRLIPPSGRSHPLITSPTATLLPLSSFLHQLPSNFLSLFILFQFSTFFLTWNFFFKESNSLKLHLLMFPAFHHRRRWNNTPSDAKSDCVITAKLRQVQLLNLVCSQGMLNGEANLRHNLYL